MTDLEKLVRRGRKGDRRVRRRAGPGISRHHSFVLAPIPMPKIPMSTVDEAVDAAMSDLKISGDGLDDLKWAVASTPAARNSQPYQDRRVCAGNTNCIPICPIQAKYDPSVTLADALRTGNVRGACTGRVASQVLVDENGRVSGIDYIQYEERQRSGRPGAAA